MENHKTKSSKADMIQVILTAAILAIMIVIGVYVVTGFHSIQKNMNLIEADLQELDMDNINQTIASLNTAAEELGSIDMKSLNQLITSLDSTASDLQSISGVMGSLFGR